MAASDLMEDGPDQPRLPDERVRSLARATGRRRGSTGHLAIVTYAGTALALITAPIVARTLGPAGRGGYAAVMTYAGLATAVLSLGIHLTVTHSVLADRRDPREVLGACVRFAIMLVPLALAAGVLVGTGFLSEYEEAARYGAFAFVALAPIGIVQLCLQSLATSSGALGTLAAVRLAPLLINLLGVVGLAIAGVLTLATYLAVTFASIFVTLVLSALLVGLTPRRGQKLRPMLRFGVRAYPAALGNIANSHLDQLLIAPFLGPTDLGHYAVAVTLANMPMGIVQAMTARYQSEITDDRDGRLLTAAAAERIRISALVSLLSMVLMAPLVPIMVPLLFGDAFAATTPLCLILLAGCVAQGTATVASATLILAGRPGAASSAQTVALVVTAVGLAVALPTIGVVGAAIVSVVAYWVRTVAQVRELHRIGVRGLVPQRGDVVVLWSRIGGQRLATAGLSGLAARVQRLRQKWRP